MLAQLVIYIFGVLKGISFITGCPKKSPEFDLFSSISEIRSIIYKVTESVIASQRKLGLKLIR